MGINRWVPTTSAIRSRSGGDYLLFAESRDLGRSEPRFLQNFGIVLAHARRLARNTGALPVDAELGRPSGQTDLSPYLPAEPRNGHLQQPAGRQQVRIVNKSPGLPTGAQETWPARSATRPRTKRRSPTVTCLWVWIERDTELYCKRMHIINNLVMDHIHWIMENQWILKRDIRSAHVHDDAH